MSSRNSIGRKRLLGSRDEMIATIREVLYPKATQPSDYNIRASWTAGLAAAAAAREHADASLPQLLTAPRERQLLLFTNASARTRFMFLHALADRAFELRFDDRSEGQRSILLASELLPALGSDRPLSGLEADVEAKVFWQLANYDRMFSRLPEAEQHFDLAHGALQRGTKDPLDRAMFNYFRAMLDMDFSLYGSANKRLSYTLRIFAKFAHRLHPDAVILRSLVQIELEQYDDAIAGFRYAIRATTDERIVLIAAHNHALALERSGQSWAALRLIHKTEALFDDDKIATPIFRLNRESLLARVFLSLGRFGDAAKKLEHVRNAYEAADMPFEAAWAGVNLAEALIHLGQQERAMTLAVELYAYAVRSGLPREALVAYLTVKEAAASTLTPVLLSKVNRFLQRHKARPHEPFTLASP